jgi:signal transduction histidine kinase/ligand-binding sensor domain-containing protein
MLGYTNSRTLSGLLRVVGISALFACGGKAFAIDPTESLSELHHTQWTTRDGVPTGATAIAQTSDGYLWIGSSSGLTRFDGVRFQPLTLADGSRPITDDVSSLFAAATGELWIGMRFGGAYVLHNGNLTHYGERDGLPPHSTVGFARRNDGSMWAQTTTGLYVLDDNHWKLIGKDWDLPGESGTIIKVDHHGTLWSRSRNGTYYLPKGASTFSKSSVPGGRGLIFVGPDDETWLNDFGTLGLVALSKPNTIRSSYWGQQHVAFLLYDRDKTLWMIFVKDNHGSLIRIPDSAEAFMHFDSPLSDGVQTLRPNQSLTGIVVSALEDQEGSVWVVTDGGIDRFRENKVHAALEEPLLSSDMAITSASGNIWLASRTYVVEFRPGQLRPETVAQYQDKDRISSLWRESDGSFLIARDDQPLMHYADHKEQVIDSLPRTKGRGDQSIVRDTSGRLWISSLGDALYRQVGSEWLLNGGYAELPHAVPVTLLSGPSGRFWLGYTDDRLAVIENDKVRMFGPADGLGVGNILAIAEHSDRVWLGGTHNAALLTRGLAFTLRNAKGEALSGVSGIVEDAQGSLWLNASNGINHVSRQEVDAFIRDPAHGVTIENFNFEDGLNGVAQQLRPVPTAAEGGAGRIWFTTTTGAYWIDPQHMHRNTRPPPVSIEGLISGGRTYSLANQATLPAHTTELEIDYAALSLSMPSRVRFKYKLDGVDADWKEAGTRRQAYYTNVPPGDHAFHVTAANEDGLWNDTGATANLLLLPAFYQTRWFYTLCGIAVVTFLWVLYRVRLRQLNHQFLERMSARVEERERIARELHDTLLQSTQGLILLFQGFAGRVRDPEPMREEMEVALDQADSLLNEARARVSDLRATGLDVNIEDTITRTGEELFADACTKVIVVTTGTPRQLVIPIADDIYRIAREALTNAYTHARAKTVEIEIAYDPEQFRVNIRDDGSGISQDVLQQGSKPNHFGLQGMRERARRAGGSLTIWSRDGVGTEIDLKIPARTAYSERQKRVRWMPTDFFRRAPTDEG